MAKKPKVLASSRFEARINKRLGGDKARNKMAFFAFIQALMAFIESCQEKKVEKLVLRIANSGPVRQVGMARRITRKSRGRMTTEEAGDYILAMVAEAKENPKDTAAMLAECCAEMEEEG